MSLSTISWLLAAAGGALGLGLGLATLGAFGSRARVRSVLAVWVGMFVACWAMVALLALIVAAVVAAMR